MPSPAPSTPVGQTQTPDQTIKYLNETHEMLSALLKKQRKEAKRQRGKDG